MYSVFVVCSDGSYATHGSAAKTHPSSNLNPFFIEFVVDDSGHCRLGDLLTRYSSNSSNNHNEPPIIYNWSRLLSVLCQNSLLQLGSGPTELAVSSDWPTLPSG